MSDDAISLSSSVGTSSGLNAAAPEFSSSQQVDMTPYDMLRSILGQTRTDEEIDVALSLHGYDLGADHHRHHGEPGPGLGAGCGAGG